MLRLPRESVLRGSSALSEFRTSLSKVLTLWHCVKVKQCYHNLCLSGQGICVVFHLFEKSPQNHFLCLVKISVQKIDIDALLKGISYQNIRKVIIPKKQTILTDIDKVFSCEFTRIYIYTLWCMRIRVYILHTYEVAQRNVKRSDMKDLFDI